MAFGKRRTSPIEDSMPGRNSTSKLEITPLAKNSQIERHTPPSITVSSYAIPENSQKLRQKYVRIVLETLNVVAAAKVDDTVLKKEICDIIKEKLTENKDALCYSEEDALIKAVTEDILGFGPIEPLLNDETVNDILINGPDNVFVERFGILESTDITFVDDNHLMNIVQRIVTKAGRRVDTTNPIVDARLPDGSRICVVIPPASTHFISVSIRKFMTDRLSLSDLIDKESMTLDIAILLQLITRLGLNVLISGGTGSGKTTLLNAMSAFIDPRERIVTIEDTAEVQLRQPNVVTLECRNESLEGQGVITQGDLLKTALRMRPNRIILGEVRDSAAGELLQAMNTGHDGSLGTLHANSIRDALMRFENLCCMDPKYSSGLGTKTQIASALDIIIQVSRMRDGKRRIVGISEIIGMEGDVYTINNLITFNAESEDDAGNIKGTWVSKSGRPHFLKNRTHIRLTNTETDMISRMAAAFRTNNVDID